jgi:hypothetical protein
MFTQVWPEGQSELIAHARVVVVEQFPHVRTTAEFSTRPFAFAVLEVAPTHQSWSEESTTGVWANDGTVHSTARTAAPAAKNRFRFTMIRSP